MPVIRVDSVDDGRLQGYRAIGDAELLRDRGLFVAEGRSVVRRLVESGQYAIESVLLNDAAHAALGSLLGTIDSRVPVIVCAPHVLSAIAGFNVHRGCLALATRPGPADLRAILRGARTVVVMEAVTDADNVGSVFRNAAAFAADAVLLSPTSCDPLYRKAVRTSMAAVLQMPFAWLNPWPDALERLRQHGFVLAALTPQTPSQTLEEFAAPKRPERLAWLVGSEGNGLSESALRMADFRIRIPITTRVDSLNLAVAAGIAMSRLPPWE